MRRLSRGEWVVTVGIMGTNRSLIWLSCHDKTMEHQGFVKVGLLTKT